MNAPVTIPVDVHDNTINTGPGTQVPKPNTLSTPDNPLDDIDPNGVQDTPDSWSEDSVDTPPPVTVEPVLPTPQPTTQG